MSTRQPRSRQAVLSKKVAIIGAGLIGSSWAMVFAKAGYRVSVFDHDEQAFVRSGKYIEDEVAHLSGRFDAGEREGIRGAINYTSDLQSALSDAFYVQESVIERTDVKKDVFAALDELADEGVIIASSASGIPCSHYTEQLSGRGRCLVVHPVNPPHLIPLVEIVPAPWTKSECVDVAFELMAAVGQSPIVVNREIEGFILNRLQGALLNEAWWLYEEGLASLNDIDKAVRDGLSLRWAFMGPFQTIDLNAPGGIADYAHRLAPLYFSIAQSRSRPTAWTEQAIENARQEMESTRRQRYDRDPGSWRNEMLRSLLQWRADNDL